MAAMIYKVTYQYAREEEKPLAEFSELSEAIFFIERKILADAEKSVTLIYRLYADHKLLKDFNIDKINRSIQTAQYAVGDRDLPPSIGPFKVSKDRAASQVMAAFIDLDNAELFIEDKLTQSSDKTTYYIFNNTVLITQIDEHVKRKLQEENPQGKGQANSFRPTPLNTTPRPPGSPPAWMKDDKEDENKK